MPFLGRLEGEKKTPEEVDDDVEVTCLNCGEMMKPREAHERDGGFVARHFWHPHETDCEGPSTGESATHRKMKSIAVSKAKGKWPESEVNVEGEIGERRADVLVEFGEKDARLGNGVAIEVQHKHEDKDIETVTDAYLAEGYSSIWVWEEHYEGKDVHLDAGEWNRYWAHQVPHAGDWGGYAEVVQWLRQDKDPSVEMEVIIPVSLKKLLPEQEIRRAWYNGFKESFDGRQDIEFRRPRHEDTDSEWVDVFKRELAGGRTSKWIKLVEAPSGELCFQAGKSKGVSDAESVTMTVSSSDYAKFVDLVSALGQLTGQGDSDE